MDLRTCLETNICFGPKQILNLITVVSIQNETMKTKTILLGFDTIEIKLCIFLLLFLQLYSIILSALFLHHPQPFLSIPDIRCLEYKILFLGLLSLLDSKVHHLIIDVSVLQLSKSASQSFWHLSVFTYSVKCLLNSCNPTQMGAWYDIIICLHYCYSPYLEQT